MFIQTLFLKITIVTSKKLTFPPESPCVLPITVKSSDVGTCWAVHNNSRPGHAALCSPSYYCRQYGADQWSKHKLIHEFIFSLSNYHSVIVLQSVTGCEPWCHLICHTCSRQFHQYDVMKINWNIFAVKLPKFYSLHFCNCQIRTSAQFICSCVLCSQIYLFCYSLLIGFLVYLAKRNSYSVLLNGRVSEECGGKQRLSILRYIANICTRNVAKSVKYPE
jgi:hypothetical protein